MQPSRSDLEQFLNKELSRLLGKPTKSVKVHDDYTVELPDYYKFVESGRKPGVKRVPLNALENYFRKIGKPLSVDALFAVQTAIFRRGIKPRPNLLSTFESIVDEAFKSVAVQYDLDTELTNLMTQNGFKHIGTSL